MANPEFELASNEACDGKEGRYDVWVHYFQSGGAAVEPFQVDLGRTAPVLAEAGALIETVHDAAHQQRRDMGEMTRNLSNLVGMSIQRDCLRKRHEHAPPPFDWQSHRKELVANIYIAAQEARSFPVDTTRQLGRRANAAVGLVPVKYSDFTQNEEGIFLPVFEPRRRQTRRPDVTGRAMPPAEGHPVVRTVELRAESSRLHRRTLLIGAIRAGLGQRQLVVQADGSPVPGLQNL